MIAFDDQFEVPAAPDPVMHQLADVPHVAQCVPGARIERQDEDGAWLGTMDAAFGPKKLRFAGKIRCSFDMVMRQGQIIGGGSAAGRSASISVRTQFTVREAPGATADAPRSVITVHAETEMQGVLAPFAAAGGAVLAAQLMRDFSNALTVRLAGQVHAAALEQHIAEAAPVASPDMSVCSAEVQTQTPAPATSLSLGGLLWRSLWNGLWRRLRRAVRRTA